MNLGLLESVFFRVITKTLQMIPASLVLGRQKKGRKYWECLSPKQAQVKPCKLILYDKEGTIKRASLPNER